MNLKINDGRGDCFQLWRNDAEALLALPDEQRREAVDALLAWFVRGDDPHDVNALVAWFLRELAQKQTRAAEAVVRKRMAQAAGGRKGMKCRWTANPATTDKLVSTADKLVIATDKLVSNENDNDNDNKNENENENENEKPQSATVSPPLSDSSVSISAAIEESARRLGDGLPSRDKWTRFMQAHGVAAFRAEVDKAATAQGVTKRGAYLNRLLDAWRPPPPPPPKPKPKAWTRSDWRLCEERCRYFDAGGCRCRMGVKAPPEKDAAHPCPPEECQLFSPCDDYGRNVGAPVPSLDALVQGIGTAERLKG